jgi:hypothetical protein
MADQEVVKEVKVKTPKVKKEPRYRKNLTAEVWAKKLASMTVEKAPEGWLGMSEIVKAAKAKGIKVSRICSAMGGDRAMNEPWEPIFQVKYVGGRKFGSPVILTEGFKKLLDLEYHKTEHKGRPKKEKVEAKPVEVKAPAVKTSTFGVAKP